MRRDGVLRCGRFELSLDRPRVMGIVNLAPDSFSGDGRYVDAGTAVSRAARLVEEGADLIDVGAESTRPGASPVLEDEEWRRLDPVLTALRELSVPVSIDTRKPAVMRRALDLGVSMVNDVTAFDSDVARSAVAASDCALCVMHMQGDPRTMQEAPHYDDVTAEVAAFLDRRADALMRAGVSHDRIVVDPGFGFGKTQDHNLTLLRALPALAARGWPVLVGMSRKGMIGRLTGRPVEQRLAGSVAAALIAVERGAAIVRVHDVAATVDALKVWQAAQVSPDEADRRPDDARRPVD